LRVDDELMEGIGMERLGTTDVFPPVEKFIYMDAASVGLTHKRTAEVINRWQQALADEGTIAFDEQDEVECLDNLNKAAGALFNASAHDIAVASSETVLMASLAWAVMPPRGSNIVATEVTHPSTIYPWMRVAETTGAELRWAAAKDYYTNPDEIESLINRDTAVVCLSHVEYGTGQVYDLERFAKAAHRHGAICVVDVTQSAGQVPIDVSKTKIDAAVASTYKWLCGPFGTGFMYVSPRLQLLQPGIIGWRSHKDMWDFQATRLEMPDSAKRYEFGTMAYGTALGATEAINYLLGHTIEKIRRHNREISRELRRGLEGLGAEILSPNHPDECSATIAARFPGKDSRSFARQLKDGNVVASLRRDFIRFSPHFYNNSSDIERGLAAIQMAL
jgi:cysteine desulfurase/selenocysteine lyase